jgi:pimeloyl-ACP methyl ester carboxylesterase
MTRSTIRVIDFVIRSREIDIESCRMDTTLLKATTVREILFVTVSACLIVTGGCCHDCHRRSWCPPNLATPLNLDELDADLSSPPIPWPAGAGSHSAAPPIQFLRAAEVNYATARFQEEQDLGACIDSYFATVQFSWPLVEWHLACGQSTPESERAWQLYHSAVAQLIDVGQRTRRLDPQRGLTVSTPGGSQILDVQVHSSVWQPEDFAGLLLVGDYAAPELTWAVRQGGVGVPLVVQGSPQPRRRWVRPGQLFAATALVRPIATDNGVCWAVEFHDPLHSPGPLVGQRGVAMAFDLTAPIAYNLNQAKRDYLRNFLQPGATSANAGLYMVEPYQRGKIPLLFVHGLLSDPLTWSDLANTIRSQPDLINRYQLWAFEYPTGEAFFVSGAALRAQLKAIRDQLDPDHCDPALGQIVIIGHSMGGLLSKLQVTNSGDTLWRSIASQPIQTLRINDTIARELSAALFFTSNPNVTRVVFIGTPHRGSQLARRCIGRIGSALVSLPAERADEYAQLIDDNPDVFEPQFRSGPPRSIDMLEPESPLLNALLVLPVSPQVTMHSIIGTEGCPALAGGPSDGVVPVSSAQLPGVASELMVNARHEQLHRDPESVAEVLRILREHATMAAGNRGRRAH